MRKTYLSEFKNKKIAYLPVGTLEWHGEHLPIETDLLIAQKVCEEVEKKVPGVILPPIYIATDIKEKDLVGMEISVGKKLPGNIFYSEPKVMEEIYDSLITYLTLFEKIFLVTGHGGKKHVEVLKRVADRYQNVIVIQPSSGTDYQLKHAGDLETSYFWACYPEEESKSRAVNIPNDDDYFVFRGYDPREKASIQKGKEILNDVVMAVVKEVKRSMEG